MKKRSRALFTLPFAILILLPWHVLGAQTAAPARSDAWQIAAATLPLPDSLRGGAAVLGYHEGKLVQLRAGTSGMICLSDNPAQKGFQASCYHRALDPFMARGRALREGGVTDRKAIDSIRRADIRAKRYEIPRAALLASVYADSQNFDALAGSPAGMTGLDVIYLPYATAASTGIPERPMENRPWLMYPGKPWAHVMLGR